MPCISTELNPALIPSTLHDVNPWEQDNDIAATTQIRIINTRAEFLSINSFNNQK